MNRAILIEFGAIREIRDELARIDDEHQANVRRNPAATDSIDVAGPGKGHAG
jgi:hypothetical protein